MSRHRPPTRAAHLDALFACPLIHDLAGELGDLNGRKRRHPLAMHLAFGAMARLYRSGNRVDAEMAHEQTWLGVLERYNKGAALHLLGVEMDHRTPPLLADTHRHVRDHLTHDVYLEILQRAFTKHSVALAHEVGLLLDDATGSRTRPHPNRTIYGDGTIVRPLYGESAKGRKDLDAQEHVRHDGKVYGNDLVAIAARGPEPQRRVILAVGRVHERGHEADTAIELVRGVWAEAGRGIQAVVYDGAFRGVHHETLMTEMGLVVVNKVAAASKKHDKRVHRQIPLGQWSHVVRRRQCLHTLMSWNGAVHDSTFDDSGTLVLSPPLARKQVRQYRRANERGYRFSLGVIVTCPREPFVAWISPHRQLKDRGYGRPDQLRLLPEADPYFQTLYGLRNDSESINSLYKRSLIADRAAALGWRRQVLDLTMWGVLTNSLAWCLFRPGGASEP